MSKKPKDDYCGADHINNETPMWPEDGNVTKKHGEGGPKLEAPLEDEGGDWYGGKNGR